MRGSLTVICGPMFAGKTTRLLDLYANTQGILFKPSFDTRYSDTDVVSHDGECFPAVRLSSIIDIADAATEGSTFFIDEVQFLDGDRYQGDFVADVKLLLNHGAKFYVSGLDMDWQGDAFPVVASLCAMADRVVKITAFCDDCGQAAGMTFKKGREEKGSVELGAGELYAPRCNEHWHP